MIEGSLEMTCFPGRSVRMGAAHPGNRPAVQGLTLVDWQSVAVGVRLLPLLKGEIIVDRIR